MNRNETNIVSQFGKSLGLFLNGRQDEEFFPVTRRQFTIAAGLLASTAFLAACAKSSPTAPIDPSPSAVLTPATRAAFDERNWATLSADKKIQAIIKKQGPDNENRSINELITATLAFDKRRHPEHEKITPKVVIANGERILENVRRDFKRPLVPEEVAAWREAIQYVPDDSNDPTIFINYDQIKLNMANAQKAGFFKTNPQLEQQSREWDLPKLTFQNAIVYGLAQLYVSHQKIEFNSVAYSMDLGGNPPTSVNYSIESMDGFVLQGYELNKDRTYKEPLSPIEIPGLSIAATHKVAAEDVEATGIQYNMLPNDTAAVKLINHVLKTTQITSEQFYKYFTGGENLGALFYQIPKFRNNQINRNTRSEEITLSIFHLIALVQQRYLAYDNALREINKYIEPAKSN